jgi:hypothetical protein
MNIVYARCGGIDVHKKRVSACCSWVDEGGKEHIEQAQFATHSSALRGLAAWFLERQVLDVAMEATGPYWRPV